MSEDLIFDRKNKDHKLFVLQRYFFWAEAFRLDYYKQIQNYKHLLESDDKGDLGVAEFLVSPAGRNLLFWCSTLRVVYEGYKEVKLSNQYVEDVNDEIKMQKLKEFRNATFHYQKDYFTNKYFDLMSEPDMESWIESLHAAFSRYLTEWQQELSSNYSDAPSPPHPTQ